MGAALDVVSLTREFVSYNSSSLLSNAPVSTAIAAWMRKAGLTVERLTYGDENGVTKVSLVGKKGRGTGGLALLGHSDVVPAEGWTSDPFKLVKKQGRLYGRGSADMKGAIACMLTAVANLSVKELKCPAYVVTTSDEEINCGGALDVMKRSRTFRSSRIRYGVICEPTLLDVVRAHKGMCRILASASGRAAHSSTGRGVNANHKMIPFLNDMVRLIEEVKNDPTYRDTAFTPPHATGNIVFSDGDTPANITAPGSRAVISWRRMPGQDWTPVLDRVRQLGKMHSVKLKISASLGPLATPADSRIIREALRITRKRTPKTVSYGTDGMAFAKKMELVVMGPGDIQQAHTTDEWIAEDQLHKGVDVFERMVRRFCVEDPG